MLLLLRCISALTSVKRFSSSGMRSVKAGRSAGFWAQQRATMSISSSGQSFLAFRIAARSGREPTARACATALNARDADRLRSSLRKTPDAWDCSEALERPEFPGDSPAIEWPEVKVAWERLDDALPPSENGVSRATICHRVMPNA